MSRIRNQLSVVCSLLLCIITFMSFPASSEAIPVFARKYKTSCTTCHWGSFPKLNAFGMAFRARNYRIPPEDEIYVKEEPVKLGSEAWKKVFPDSVWPSTLPSIPALSIAIGSDFQMTPRNRSNTANNFFTGIAEVELLTAGTLGESFSWFGALVLNETGGFNFESETEIERFYWQYTPRFFGDNPGLVSLRAGVFETRAAPFRDNLRLLATDSLADRFPVVPASDFSRLAKQVGVEIFGAHNGPGGKGGLRWAAGVVNGSPGGFGAFDSAAFSSDSIVSNVKSEWDGKFDINNNKDFYARLNYKIGGMGVLGGTTDETLKTSKNWQDNSLTLGTFFYRGTTGFFRDPVAGTGFDHNGNRFWRFGGEAHLDWWNFKLAAAATFYRDNTTDPVTIGGVSGDDFDVDIYTFRADYVALPWLIPAFRIENVNPDYDVDDWPSFTRSSIDLTLLLRANIKAVMGGSFTSGNWHGPRPEAIDDTYHLSMEMVF